MIQISPKVETVECIVIDEKCTTLKRDFPFGAYQPYMSTLQTLFFSAGYIVG